MGFSPFVVLYTSVSRVIMFLLSMVNLSSFTDSDDSIVLLSITNYLLIVFLLRITNWNFPGLAIN